MSAIAAFLVLSAPGAFAQETPTVTMTPPVAAPTPQTPPTVPEPATTAPLAAPQTAQPPALKPVIRVPLDIASEPAAAAPKTAERAAAATPAPARANRTRAAAAVAAPVAAPVAEAPAFTEVTPIAAPVTAPAEPVADAAPLPTEQASATGSNFPWEIVGGAGALLIAGGAGLAFARRRRTANKVDEEAPVYTYDRAPTAEPVTAEASRQWVTPAYTSHEEAVPAPRTVPAFAATPSGSVGRHEAMALAGPTDDNPFATLSKRLKHARFLDRQERAVYDETLGAQKDMVRKPVSAWEIAQRPVAPAPQEQEVRRTEPARTRTTTTFRPGFSRN